MYCSKLLLALVAMLVVGTAQAAERESALTGTCFTNVQDIGNSTDLDSVRGSVVVYNKMKSYYREADVLAIYRLDKPGKINLQGCANLCVLDWRTDGNGTDVNTTCSTSDDLCPMTSGTVVPNRKCEAFMYNVNSKKCYIIGGDGRLLLRKSNSYYSGFVECSDVDSVDEWANAVTR